MSPTLHCLIELSQIVEFLSGGNGQNIMYINQAQEVQPAAIQYFCEITASEFDADWYVERRDIQAYVWQVDGEIGMATDLVGLPDLIDVYLGIRELLAARAMLRQCAVQFRQFSHQIVMWPTGSATCYGCLQRGARTRAIQELVLDIKMLENDYSIRLKPVWSPQDELRVTIAGLNTETARSTDEWSASRQHLAALFDTAGVHPMVNTFAAQCNSVCENYFSRHVQPTSAGVNFFSQPLLSSEIYFCCPPVSLIVPCYRRLTKSTGIVSWLLVPEWPAASFWPVLFPVAPTVEKLYRFKTSFHFANNAQSNIFSKNPSFHLRALLIKT